MHRIVIVGGGAGGLELATRLGDTLGKHKRAHITLIEKARTHFWKPHLHEIAAGSMDIGRYQTDYLSQSHWHHFTYRIGEATRVDRQARVVHVAPLIDDRDEVAEARQFGYDTLVVAIGSLTNDFGTRGVAQYAIPLEDARQAERFHRRLINACIRANDQQGPLRPEQLQVAIIGAGATGVELAAELPNTTRTLVSFGLDRIDALSDIRIIVIEAADRILPALPERLSTQATQMLADLGVHVRTSAKVAEVLPEGVKLASGELIPAELVVWAAGVKASDVLLQFDDLEVNKLNQLVVDATLRTTRDEHVFALGDCAACPWLGHEGRTVPPRAQAAHQQASFLVKQIGRRLDGKPLKEWRYRDFGSLVSLGEKSTVGNLMGGTVGGGNLWVDGWIARLMYLSLYKMHELALHGYRKTALDTLSRLITRRTVPRIKLH
jgi:NADH dehydrogenase